MRRQYTERPPEFEIYDGYHPFKNGLAFAGLGRFTGSTLYYDSSHGNNGTLTNMDPATDWTRIAGRPACNFDQSNDRIVTENTVPHNIGAGNFTYVAVCQVDPTIGVVGTLTGIVANSDYNPVFGLSNGVHGTKYNLMWYAGGWYDLGLAVPLGTPCCLVYRRTGTLVEGFVNGVLAPSTTTKITNFPNDRLVIGRSGVTFISDYFKGDISDVAVYNRALSLGEISAYSDLSNVIFRLGGSDLLRYRPRRSRIYFSGAAAQRWPWQQRYRRRMTGAY